jgi:hypothetical protein
MRSEQVHRALIQIPNRFNLCGTLSRATRTLHVMQTRTEDTMSTVLNGIGDGKYGTVLISPAK